MKETPRIPLEDAFPHGTKRTAMLELIGLVAKVNVLSQKPLDLMSPDDAKDLAYLHSQLAGAYTVYSKEITSEKGN